ncbi:class I SAM-dependent methyltransferase [Sandaracinobacteroides saxicola]|uniref:Class I SAM-dependent methyltransferase n=1 Tax=Sandaracinobacteroides saxicola TaxID=2759707 RepID=A0A7G5IGZ0_9SPHN|nr:class I SAM-dependent methyltransferase [Sandaracinobacteroides saxicola]QMW22632.1 class I SAM-dependent methyltransferase [Sandaracinobacteroides saxicola]
MSQLKTWVTEPGGDFALLDSGHGRKLERYGRYRFIRPEPQAMWAPAGADWRADGEFIGGSDEEGGGRWHIPGEVPASWVVEAFPGVDIHAACTPFRHLAYFPDMMPHWRMIADTLRPGDEFLNLFGYTGVASLVAAKAGARVTHVDASKKAVEAARANAALNGVESVRWIVEDARKFVAREVRRGRVYAGILLDPPKFGRGPAGETWELTRDLAPLLSDCAALLGAESRFMVLTTYALRLSAHALDALMRQVMGARGEVESGELGVREGARGLVLGTALSAAWRKIA